MKDLILINQVRDAHVGPWRFFILRWYLRVYRPHTWIFLDTPLNREKANDADEMVYPIH